eukprot:3159154-Amphidinium_carterae.1
MLGLLPALSGSNCFHGLNCTFASALHGALETILKDLDLGMTWQATSRVVQVRSAQFGVEDVQTL